MFGRPVTIRTDDRDLAALLDALLLGLRVPDAPSGPALELVFDAVEAEHVAITTKGTTLTVRADDAVPVAMAVLNELAGEGPGLLVHASAVAMGSRVAVFPGASGAGKSTLAARLVASGLQYLTDEVVAIALPDAVVCPYAKPIALKAGSQRAFPELRPPVPPEQERFVASSWLLAPQWLHPRALEHDPDLAVATVIVPRRTAGASRLVALSRAEAVSALVNSAFNFLATGGELLRPLADVVRETACFQLLVGDDGDRAIELVHAALEG